MKTSYISTQNLWNAPRTGAARLQAELAKANEEVVTGTHADLGLALGSRTAVSLALRRQRTDLDAITQDNALTSLRLDGTQAALRTMREDADKTLKELLAATVQQRGTLVATAAGERLATLASTLNGSSGGQYLFAGINAQEAPLTAYAGSPPSAARGAVEAAFRTAFGVDPGAAGAAAITPAQMAAFLDGPFAGLFTETAWSGTWSDASSRTIQSRIAPDETAETSASANAAPFRTLAMAYVMASGLGTGSLSAETQAVVTDRIAARLREASAGVAGIEGGLGTSQARIKEAETRMTAQKALLATRIGELEGVDPAEAKTRIDRLTTQIQMSYSLTAQLRQLSLVSYL
ncbi:flagellar hook-associated family protein [Methylobacterium oryzisoli]|uniref:flagellar hook-associated family protein n=1 Tax=Methylobacterium oryzisoli TaxID=3385502 RepID=UPI0038918E15